MPFYYRDPDAPSPNRPRRVGVVALIERNGRLLLERRRDAPLWSLIGGAVEEDESLGEALVREVHEETGLSVESYDLFGTFSDPSRIVSYPGGNIHRVITIAYLVRVDGFGSLRASDESEALRFFNRDELLRLDLPSTQRHIVELFVAPWSPPHLH